MHLRVYMCKMFFKKFIANMVGSISADMSMCI